MGGMFTSVALAQVPDRMLVYDDGDLKVRAHLQAGVNLVTESNLFWNFANIFAPGHGFNSDTSWIEGYVKPGLSVEKRINQSFSAYGKISTVASGTLGTDAYDTGDTGRITLEEAYVGLRSTPPEDGFGWDLSVGPRELKLGTSMLVSNGGSSGFDRGALKLGPRKAWEMAVIGRLQYGDAEATAFFLDANEQSDSDSGTQLIGLDLRTDLASGGYLGGTLLYVPTSTSPYPKAQGGGPPTILPDAREGLTALNIYGRWEDFGDALDGLFVTGDVAVETHDRIDMLAWAGRVQVGYMFKDTAWAPTLTYSYQTFSGDDPDTAKLERFDPLYYDGSPSSWGSGSKSSMVFINSNVQAHQLALRVTPTPEDIVTLRYAHIRANELGSPIQFGQAARPFAGVLDAHLADDVFLEWTRVLSRNAYLTAGVSVSVPGPGLEGVVNSDLPFWTGGFVNLVVDF